MNTQIFIRILSTSFMLVCLSAAFAQSIGKIEYYEGKVMIGENNNWTDVKIGLQLTGSQSLRTLGDAMAEVTWNNGQKSIVGPGTEVRIAELQKGIAGTAKTETAGSFNNFKQLFNKESAQKRSQEGGIRRTEAVAKEAPKADEVYWKESEEVDFAEAYQLYESGDHRAAIKALQLFLYQQPQHENARYAWFALGHSYILSNNTVKAKEIFERFLVDYPEDALKPEAEQILSFL